MIIEKEIVAKPIIESESIISFNTIDNLKYNPPKLSHLEKQIIKDGQRIKKSLDQELKTDFKSMFLKSFANKPLPKSILKQEESVNKTCKTLCITEVLESNYIVLDKKNISDEINYWNDILKTSKQISLLAYMKLGKLLILLKKDFIKNSDFKNYLIGKEINYSDRYIQKLIQFNRLADEYPKILTTTFSFYKITNNLKDIEEIIKTENEIEQLI